MFSINWKDPQRDEEEKKGVAGMLQLIGEGDVRSLAETITKKLIRIESKQEAVTAICMYASCASDVLHRQKIRKDFLFKYLNENGVAVEPSANKGVFIDAVIDLWHRSTSVNTIDHPQQTLANNLSCGAGVADTQNVNLQQLGYSFVPWFYHLLNSVCHSSGYNSTEQFGPHHFWVDCVLVIQQKSYFDGNFAEEEYHSAVETHSQFERLVKHEQFVFNPNCTSGVNTSMDVHGLVLVFAAGTLHRKDKCVGVFEQIFGLVRDVSCMDNWKIKWTKLMISDSSPASVHQSQMMY